MRAEERDARVGPRDVGLDACECEARVEARARVCGVAPREIGEALPEKPSLRLAPLVGEVEQVQEVEPALAREHVIHAAHDVAAAHEHDLVDVGGHHAFDERLAVAAEVGVGETVGLVERRDVRLGELAGRAKAAEQLDGGVLAGVEHDVPIAPAPT